MEKVDYLKVGKMFPNLKSGDAWIILIVPSITSFEQKLELQASGSGRIMGKEAELLIREMNSSFVPAHDLRNPEIYSMFFYLGIGLQAKPMFGFVRLKVIG
jgi:hypothetical protein